MSNLPIKINQEHLKESISKETQIQLFKIEEPPPIKIPLTNVDQIFLEILKDRIKKYFRIQITHKETVYNSKTNNSI